MIVVASHGLGKTMIAKNLVHQAILAGHSARFMNAADVILDLTKQETARALQHRLRTYMRPSLLAIDEVGYLAYDAHAADLLFQVVSRRYEQKSLVITTNLPFKQWDTSFRMRPARSRSLTDSRTTPRSSPLKASRIGSARPSRRKSAGRSRSRSADGRETVRTLSVQIYAVLHERRHSHACRGLVD